MNANELADLLTETAKFVDNITDNYQAVKDIKEAATMLRQQQAEIEALKAENKVLRKGELWLGMVYNNRGAGIAPMYLENFMQFCETNGFTEESGYKLFKKAQ